MSRARLVKWQTLLNFAVFVCVSTQYVMWLTHYSVSHILLLLIVCLHYNKTFLQKYLCIVLTEQAMMGLCMFYIGWRFEVTKRISTKALLVYKPVLIWDTPRLMKFLLIWMTSKDVGRVYYQMLIYEGWHLHVVLQIGILFIKWLFNPSLYL